MSAIRVAVTAEHIAAAGVIAPEAILPEGQQDPVEIALQALTGEPAMCDEDGPGETMATIGQGRNTLVVSLPPSVSLFCDRYYAGEAVEPFEFDLEIEAWLIWLAGSAGVVP